MYLRQYLLQPSMRVERRTSLKINLLVYFVFSVVTESICSFQERIHIKRNKIYIKYEHQLKSKDESTDFQQTVDISVFHDVVEPLICSNDSVENIYCLKWGDFAQFKITKNDNCEDFEYKTEFNVTLSVVFNIANIYMYGGPEQNHQAWPIGSNKFNKYSYVSKENESQAVLEPYWLVSSGFYLYVYDEVPLFISQNKDNNEFEIAASRESPYTRENITCLKYKVCKFENMKAAHRHAINNVLGKPTGVPDYRMVQLPIWSTWAKYKTNISEETVLEYARDILKYGLPHSQLEIDDEWETCYGSLATNKKKFPNMKQLVRRLKNMGFRVTIWVHPFINLDCEPYYSEAMEFDFFVKNVDNSVNSVWWNGRASYIDFTNPKAANWWQTRLKKIKAETGIDSFKFDAGESSWSPTPPVFHVMRNDHPETILKAYVHAASEFGDMVEVRSARSTQQYPIFVRMMDRETNWDYNRGLSTIIPTLLHMNILGYPFVLPDMIGGNGYNGDIVTEEMFIRWLQINVFMPSLQFSYPPWEYGKNVLKIVEKFISLHKNYSMKIMELMIHATETGTPVNPPIWWIDPTDAIAHTIDSEFLLGEDILVAPVVKKGATYRNIYLPKGLWKDEVKQNAKLIEGPVWLINYPANLDELPYFSRVGSGATSLASITTLIVSTLILTIRINKI